jgi:hypothetical protein
MILTEASVFKSYVVNEKAPVYKRKKRKKSSKTSIPVLIDSIREGLWMNITVRPHTDIK